VYRYGIDKYILAENLEKLGKKGGQMAVRSRSYLQDYITMLVMWSIIVFLWSY
jgi:hypothetical protein